MKKIKVAITGGMGSGKSTAAQYVTSLGYPVFSCDDIYKDIYNSADFQKSLCQEFSSCIVNGRIDKKLLSALVFSDKDALKRLNNLSHAKIMAKLNQLMDSVEGRLVFAEVPLLFETKMESNFNFALVILRNRRDRISSICSRDGLSEGDALARINNQWDYDAKENLDFLKDERFFVIENNSSVEFLKTEIQNFLKSLSRETIFGKQ